LTINNDNQHIEQLKQAYSKKVVSDSYIDERFTSGIGRLLHEAQVKFVVEVINSYKINNVLEIAPGPARLTVDIGRACQKTSGIIMDVNANMLEHAQKRLDSAGLAGRWETKLGDAFDLPFSDVFQMVYTFRFIRHFHEKEREMIYRQIRQHLVPNGYLVFDAINRAVSEPLRAMASPDEYPIYDEMFDYPELAKEIEMNGFRIVELVAVQRNYSLLNKIQILVGPRSTKLAYFLMKLIEGTGKGQPLEWIVLCQKK
jgi:ubiquinone/menaquinone biosynthesis C-methylase UbiE